MCRENPFLSSFSFFFFSLAFRVFAFQEKKMKCDNKECKTPKEKIEQQKDGFRCPYCPKSLYCCGKCFTEDEELHKEVCNIPNSRSKNPYLKSKYKEATDCIPDINKLAEIIRTDVHINRWLACLWDRRLKQSANSTDYTNRAEHSENKQIMGGWLEICFSGPTDLKMNLAENVFKRCIEKVALEALFRRHTTATCANGQFSMIINVGILSEKVLFASAIEFSFDRLIHFDLKQVDPDLISDDSLTSVVAPETKVDSEIEPKTKIKASENELVLFVDISGRIGHLSALSLRKLYREHVFNKIRNMEMPTKKRDEIVMALFKYVKDNVYSIFLLECDPPLVVECRPTLNMQKCN